MFQGDGLGLLRANIGIGLGLVTARRIPFNILIEAHDIPGGGIDLVVILLIAGEKLHIIHPEAVLIVQVGIDNRSIRGGQACVLQSDGFGLLRTNIGTGLRHRVGTGHVPFNIIIEAENSAGRCVDFVVVLLVPKQKFHIVFHPAVVIVLLGEDPGHLGSIHPSVIQGNLLRFGLADIGRLLEMGNRLMGGGVHRH